MTPLLCNQEEVFEEEIQKRRRLEEAIQSKKAHHPLIREHILNDTRVPDMIIGYTPQLGDSGLSGLSSSRNFPKEFCFVSCRQWMVKFLPQSTATDII